MTATCWLNRTSNHGRMSTCSRTGTSRRTGSCDRTACYGWQGADVEPPSDRTQGTR